MTECVSISGAAGAAFRPRLSQDLRHLLRMAIASMPVIRSSTPNS